MRDDWPASRVAALVLTIGLTALAVYSWRAGTGDARAWWLLGVGVVLGLLYTYRGGTLPGFVHSLGGSGLTRDDDPRNLLPRVYLPILLGAIVTAAAVYYFFAPGR